MRLAVGPHPTKGTRGRGELVNDKIMLEIVGESGEPGKGCFNFTLTGLAMVALGLTGWMVFA